MGSNRTGLTVLAGALLAVALCALAGAQELKPWKHGVIEPKGDAGFSLMVSRHGFAEKQGLKLDILTFKNGATAHKALLAGEIDSIESVRAPLFSQAPTAPISKFSVAIGRACRTA